MAWTETVHDLLKQNFSLIGDANLTLFQVSDSEYKLYASGRRNCQAMTIYIDLVKRHDLLNLLMGLITPSYDRLIFETTMDDSVQKFVLLLARKAEEKRLRKDQPEVELFSKPVHPNEVPQLSEGLVLRSEHPDITESVLQRIPVLKFARALGKNFISLYIADRDPQPAPEAAQGTAPPPSAPVDPSARPFVLQMVLRMAPVALAPAAPGASPAPADAEVAPVNFFLGLIDGLAEIRHSKAAIAHVENQRTIAAKSAFQATAAQRQEEAQKRKEEKFRREQEEIMKLPPEEQRRREAKLIKQQNKKSLGQRMKVVFQ